MTHFLKYLFNLPEYGSIAGGSGLYRRFVRSKVIQYKSEFGWTTIDEWPTPKNIFEPATSDLAYIKLPDRSFACYSLKQRDSIGEKNFEIWCDKQRKACLEMMIRRKAKVKL
jgi:hypothetical protein